MAWDLSVSEDGDLIFAANGDLGGISGPQLIEQRMVTRLRLQRGTWTYDQDQTLGSNLFTLVGKPPDEAALTAPALVREALRPMEDITVDDTQIQSTTKDISITVFYRLRSLPDEAAEDTIEEERQLTFTLPFVAGGSF